MNHYMTADMAGGIAEGLFFLFSGVMVISCLMKQYMVTMFSGVSVQIWLALYLLTEVMK